MKNIFIGLGLLLNLLSVVYGMKILIDYSKQAGPEGQITDSWPEQSILERSPGLPTLVMSVHSMCSCTRASVEELARIMSKVEGKLTAIILMIPVSGQRDEDAKLSYTWERGSETPGVKLYIDHEGIETKRFGALVSGKVMLFDRFGKLVFHGGITASRGHEGDNAGRAQIVSWVLNPSNVNALKSTPVFGCHLFDSGNHAM